MKFSICNELYFDRSIASAFEHARSIGYEGIEIAPFTLGQSVDEISHQARRDTVQAAAAADIEIVGLHWLLAKTEGYHLTSEDRDVRQRTLDYLIRLAELCSDLGGKVMVFGSPQQRSLGNSTSKQVGLARAREVFQPLVPRLESLDVHLAIEPLGPEETNFLTTAESTIELIKEIDSPYVGLILDVKAMSTEASPIPQIIEQSSQWLKHFHANDPNRQGPGMGEVDFKPILQALTSVGYQQWVSVEVFDYSPGVETLARESFRTLRQS